MAGIPYLQRAFYLDNSPLVQLRQSLLFGAFVGLFLWFFEPFGLRALGAALPQVCLGFAGITTAVMLLLNLAIPPLLPGIFDPEKWTIGRELLWTIVHIFCIGLANYVYFAIRLQGSFSWSAVLWFQLVTLVIGLFPTSLFLMFKQRRDEQHFAHTGRQISRRLGGRVQESAPGGHLVIASHNGAELFSCRPDELIYIEAFDNYISIFHVKNGTEDRQLMRQTLAAAALALEGYRNFYQCHRSYVVNLARVKEVSGNAQGYKLALHGTDKLVPVSRKMAGGFLERLRGM